MLNQSINETSSKDSIEIADSVEFKDSGELICKYLGNKIYRHIEYRIDISYRFYYFNIEYRIEISIYRIDIVSNQKSFYRNYRNIDIVVP